MKLENRLKIINISLPIVLFIILLLSKLSEKTVYIFVMTLFVGWALPYFVLLITGLAQVKNLFHKLGLTLNILSIPMCILLLYLVITIYDKKLLIFIVEYIIIVLMNILNIIYYTRYIKSHPEMSRKELAEMFNVSPRTISDIRLGRTWKTVEKIC
jgi:hypothetical protein